MKRFEHWVVFVELKIKTFWKRIFNSKENCRYFVNSLCIKRLWKTSSFYSEEIEDNSICNGIYEKFERKKRL